VLKNLLQKIFNFGQQEEETVVIKTAIMEETSNAAKRKNETLSECRSLLCIAQEQRIEKRNAEVLLTLEKIVEIMEREEL
jgi:hypothetical protein